MFSRKSIKIVFIYATVSILWIFFSDQIASFLFSSSPTTLLWVSTLKGWFYVVIVSALLFLLLEHDEKKSSKQSFDLKESEARYRSVIENISDVYYRTDSNGIIIMVSPSSCSLLKYDSVNEIIGRQIESFWETPEERDTFLKILHKNKDIRDYDVKILRKDSVQVSVSTSSKFYYDSSGAVAGVEGIFRDISHRKQNEEKLKKSEERLKRAELVAKTGNWEIDLSSGNVTSSDGARFIYGVTDEAVSLDDIKMIPLPEYRNKLDDAFDKLITQGGLYEIEFKIARKTDGKIIDIHSVATYDSNSSMVFGIIMDITDRKLVEEMKTANEKKFRAIFEYSPVGILLNDENGVVLDCNKSFANIFNHSVDFYIGRNLMLDMQEGLNKIAIVRGIREKSVQIFEGSYEPISGGKPLEIRSTVAPISESLFVHIVEDFTSRKKMQEIIIQTEKMMSVGGLAAGMAHEINNPLSGILQNVQVLQKRLTSESPTNTEAAKDVGCSFHSISSFMKARGVFDSLEGIRESGVRAAHVVKTMLDFSRKDESRNAPACLNDLLDKAVELCSTDYDLTKKFDFRAIRIVREYTTNLPDVPCSITQIQQVFMNLLGNAAHAMINIFEPSITLRTKSIDGMVRVDIVDNGHGMDKETRRRVFEPFFTTKPVGEGTGLGLSVSYFIITNNHNGSLEVSSELGSGTTFTITLPVII